MIKNKIIMGGHVSDFKKFQKAEAKKIEEQENPTPDLLAVPEEFKAEQDVIMQLNDSIASIEQDLASKKVELNNKNKDLQNKMAAKQSQISNQQKSVSGTVPPPVPNQPAV